MDGVNANFHQQFMSSLNFTVRDCDLPFSNGQLTSRISADFSANLGEVQKRPLLFFLADLSFL